MLAFTQKILRQLALSQEIMAGGFIVIAILLVGISWYGYTRISALSEQVANLSATAADLGNTIADATSTLGNALLQERQNVEGVKNQVGAIGGTVTDLQKLNTIDLQLLAKYSKVFFLSENYAPARLAEIPTNYLYDEKRPQQIIPQVSPFLEDLLAHAKRADIELFVDSAYRSFDTQVALKEHYIVTYGAGTANHFSAEQGYSEHQLGTAVDFITLGTGGQLDGFDKKPAYPWLLKNAYRYGFVLSYPKNNSYYMFEPWHWRFVGVKLATKLHDSDEYFYEMDQRTIDTYLISLFDN